MKEAADMKTGMADPRWCDAESRARAKEAELQEAWQRYFDRRAGLPSDALIREASMLRQQANELDSLRRTRP